ncbi:MAG: hypothetical protein M1831_000848 [Alyxoria varia]|nr:MAG: hypothetical protein M1831_000848 [Alyxoria varia]
MAPLVKAMLPILLSFLHVFQTCEGSPTQPASNSNETLRWVGETNTYAECEHDTLEADVTSHLPMDDKHDRKLLFKRTGSQPEREPLRNFGKFGRGSSSRETGRERERDQGTPYPPAGRVRSSLSSMGPPPIPPEAQYRIFPGRWKDQSPPATTENTLDPKPRDVTMMRLFSALTEALNEDSQMCADGYPTKLRQQIVRDEFNFVDQTWTEYAVWWSWLNWHDVPWRTRGCDPSSVPLARVVMRLIPGDLGQDMTLEEWFELHASEPDPHNTSGESRPTQLYWGNYDYHTSDNMKYSFVFRITGGR